MRSTFLSGHFYIPMDLNNPFSGDASFEPDHDNIELIEELYPSIEKYQHLAKEYSIEDIFQDNGGKLLQVLAMLGLENIPDRQGNDAVDRYGNEYELKSVNLDKRSPQFTTHHHLNIERLNKYRSIGWIFATYEGIDIREIYYSPPERIENPYFTRWEEKLKRKIQDPDEDNHLNNPKISVSHVRNVGNKLFPDGGQGDLF